MDIKDFKDYLGLKPFKGSDPELELKVIPFNIPQLDSIIGGGVPQGHIMELVGEFASGKSLLAQKAIQSAQKMGLEVLYYNAENKFSQAWFAKCLPARTKIVSYTADKFHKISNRYIEDIKIGDLVLSYNIKTGMKEFKEVIETYKNGDDEFIKITFSNNNTLVCTKEHPLGINIDGSIEWREANDINVGDECVQYKYCGLSAISSARSKKGKKLNEMYTLEVAEKMKGVLRDARVLAKTLEVRSKVSKAKKEIWADEYSAYNSKEYRDSLSKAKLGVPSSVRLGGAENAAIVESKRKKTILAKYGKFPFTMKGKHHTNESKTKIGIGTAKANNVHPNVLENLTEEALNIICKGKFENNVRGEIQRANNLNFPGIPDFVWLEGRKVVFANGCSWHCCPVCGYEIDPRGRLAKDVISRDNEKIIELKKLGWDSLVIWRHEFKNPIKLGQKIKNFVFNPNTEIVKVTNIELIHKRLDTYNLRVKDNNNYFAEGILTHNCGVDTDKLIVIQGNILESVVDSIIASITAKIGLIVVDSIAALIPISEYEEETSQNTVGLQARVMSKAFRKIMSPLSISRTAIIFINQLRSGIGAYAVDTYPSGRAQNFYSSVTIHVRRGDWITANIEGTEVRKGFQIMCRTVKNTLAPPWTEAKIPLRFTGEIDFVATICEMAISSEIIKKGGAGWFTLHNGQRIQGLEKVFEFYKGDNNMLKELSQKIAGTE